MAVDDPRYQPEFAPGERLASLEALIKDLQPQLDRRFEEHEKLFGERLEGMRREMEAKSDAQKAAVDKAEQASSTQFSTFIEQNERKSDVTQQRLAAIERITSEDTGARQYKASLWVAAGVLATVGYLVVILITTKVL